MDTAKGKQISEAYSSEFMMGPNAVIILQELLQAQPLRQGWRVLDLGCGKGLSSIYLASL
ncbi:MAG: hypothetical protein PHP02_02120 [Eubacteriales bacterium]|nr:hypothetical protein [Eubacteriales bacterium]